MTQRSDDTPFHDSALNYLRALHEPSLGIPSLLTEVCANEDGTAVIVTAAVRDTLSGVPRQALYSVEDGGFRAIAQDVSSSSKGASFSPDGERVCFLSDRQQAGVFQLFVSSSGDVDSPSACPVVDGTIEYAQWSPSGTRILLGVAGIGADLGSVNGAITNTAAKSDRAGWYPRVEYGTPANAWRSLWVYDTGDRSVEQLSEDGLNYWESAWCGEDRIVAVASSAPEEDAWYQADIVQIDLEHGTPVIRFSSPVQLGALAGSPDGRRFAFVQALCSDRGLVAGDAFVMDCVSGDVSPIDTSEVDVTFLQWLDAGRLGYFGLRHIDSVAGIVDVDLGRPAELSKGRGEIAADRLPRGLFLPNGEALVIQDSYLRPHEIAVLGRSGEAILATAENAGTRQVASTGGRVTKVHWTAPDGLTIEGIVCAPHGEGPFPTVLNIHGGPAWVHRESWMMRQSVVPFLVSHGVAVFCPNPRGSVGRGQEFAGAVVGDFGGAEMHDHLSGIDHLVRIGMADPRRLGVMGGSHGGYLASWIVTQDHRFAAAVPSSPVTDWLSWVYTSNIPGFGFSNLKDSPETLGSAFHQRSPIAHVSKVTTPCLTIAGALDKCTPAGQAIEFHNALRRQGIESALCVYPEEGHGVRGLEAEIDFNARVTDWFISHFAK